MFLTKTFTPAGVQFGYPFSITFFSSIFKHAGALASCSRRRSGVLSHDVDLVKLYFIFLFLVFCNLDFCAFFFAVMPTNP